MKWQSKDNSRQTLTAIRVISYDVVPATPVPQKQRGISGSRYNVAVPTDVWLRPGQARDHVPVAKYNLSQFPWNTESTGSPHSFFFKWEYVELHFTRFINSESRDSQIYKVIQI